MLQRILIAIFVLPILGFLVFLKNPYPILSIAILAFLITLYEIFLMFEKKEIKIFKKVGIFFSLIIFILLILNSNLEYIFYTWTILLIFLFLITIFTKKPENILGVFFTFGSVAYITFFSLFVFKLRFQENGIYFLFLLPYLSWMYDAGAYFVGKFFGKNKLIPELSPGKTKEGFLGGILITIVATIIIKYTVLSGINGFDLKDAILLPVLTSFFGQMGDITASVIKRYCGVKNSSSLLSEHGGFLDKLDSMLFNAPIIYFYIKYLVI